MAINEFQHVRSGERIVIPAQTYNAMLDAAQAHRNRRLNLSPHGPAFDSLFVHVENATGKYLERFDVVGLDGPSETQTLDVFCNRIAFRGVVPKKEHRGKFAVLQQDAAPGMLVRACVVGVTVVKIQCDSNRAVPTCDVEEGVTSHLVSGGSVEVLWSDTPNRTRWSLIRLGGGFSILRGELARACDDGDDTVRVRTEEGDTIEVVVPYPDDLQKCPEGHPCRYYADRDGWSLLDIACPPRKES